MTVELRRVHIVGIGGAGMSGIARIMAAQGIEVSGTDARDSLRLAALRPLGIDARAGHDPSAIRGADAVIVSTAIPEENPERLAAVRAGIPVLGRADALRLVMQGRRGLAVAGTHGKTTTTAMLTVAMQHCGAEPSFAIGSELNESGSNAHLGTGGFFVVEADESDGAFLQLEAEAGIVTNVEPDHLNHWGSFEAIEDAFAEFAGGIRARGGFLVVCADDPGAARLAARTAQSGTDVRSYGFDDGAAFRLRESGSPWAFSVGGGPVIALQVPGRHNMLNAAAAFLVATGVGEAPDRVAEGLSAFTGSRRRFEFKGLAAGVRVFDDYAHHPTEIAATLHAARTVAGDGRVVAAFQAHHVYRTALFLEEFGEALGLADEVVVLEVFAPGETPIPGATGRGLAERIPLPPDRVHFEPSWSSVAGRLAECARPGDMIITMGAGDIGLIAGEVLDLLRESGG